MISNKDASLPLAESHPPYHPKILRRTPRPHRPYLVLIASLVAAGLFYYAIRSGGYALYYGGPCVARDSFAEIAAANPKRSAIYTRLSHLIVVAGHAIYTGSTYNTYADVTDESRWILEPFQKGQVATFLRHIAYGVDLMRNDTRSLLIFSGGQTRYMAGPRSEALSYYLVANLTTNNIYRVSTEEYARDSHENLLFSICRFRQITGHYPRNISVVSFAFKQSRFKHIHRSAIRWPIARWNFHGINPDDTAYSALHGETSNSFGPFLDDPYACIHKGLRQKKIDRNPFARFAPYPQGCPELSQLFKYCGHTFFKGKLPWDNLI